MIIFVDNENKCHIENDGTMYQVEASFFDGKCKNFIEGYKCFYEDGLTIFPWEDYSLLERFQSQYEQSQSELNSILTQIETALEVPDDD